MSARSYFDRHSSREPLAVRQRVCLDGGDANDRPLPINNPHQNTRRLLSPLSPRLWRRRRPTRWDCWEADRRDRTALFWAAGGGSVDACAALVEGEGGLRPRDSGGDGSTPLHWAAAGVETRRFGTGGHVNVRFQFAALLVICMTKAVNSWVCLGGGGEGGGGDSSDELLTLQSVCSSSPAGLSVSCG